jgi:hypothetical protein
MAEVAKLHKLKRIIRVTHDKVFVHYTMIFAFLKIFDESKADYVYSSDFIPGSAFEIISRRALLSAAKKYRNVEHVSYAIRLTANKSVNLILKRSPGPHRLLIDYPEDLNVLRKVITELGIDCTLDQAIEYLDKNPDVSTENKLPQVTIYTCAYNAGKWISQCMSSVALQEGFEKFEYIIVDDKSTDNTLEEIEKFAKRHKNVRVFKNKINLGLATSSNKALSNAKGSFILRLDADDYFTTSTMLKTMLLFIDGTEYDAVYPDFYDGSIRNIVEGANVHHIGGALFRTRAVNFIKFTDGLRHLEGYDFFARARSQLNIGYLRRPGFFYRRTPGSMSKQNPQTRKQIKEGIDEKTCTT